MTEYASYGQGALREGNVDREALVSEKSTQSVTNTAKRCNLESLAHWQMIIILR